MQMHDIGGGGIVAGEITVKVQLRQHKIGLAIWKIIVWAFGVRSGIARRTWSFFEPLEINIEGRGWKRANPYKSHRRINGLG